MGLADRRYMYEPRPRRRRAVCWVRSKWRELLLVAVAVVVALFVRIVMPV